MRSKNCLLCGQIIYPPLLEEYEKREQELIAVIQRTALEYGGLSSKEATEFAHKILAEMEKIFI